MRTFVVYVYGEEDGPELPDANSVWESIDRSGSISVDVLQLEDGYQLPDRGLPVVDSA